MIHGMHDTSPILAVCSSSAHYHTPHHHLIRLLYILFLYCAKSEGVPMKGLGPRYACHDDTSE